MANHENESVKNFFKIVGRNVGGHSHGDSGCSVEQEVGNDRRKNLGFFQVARIIQTEINRFFFDILEEFRGDWGEAAFGVAHRRGGVAIDRAEVALAVN